jgi:preprotein translocase subunit SecF
MGIFGKNEHNTYVVNKKTTGAAVVEGLLGATKKTDAEAMAEAQADVERERVRNESKAEHIAQIQAVQLTGSAEDISMALNNLFALYQGKHPSDSEKESKKAIREKIDYGLMKLQKLDAADASFFQKKLDAIGVAEKKLVRRKVLLGILGGLAFIIFMIICFNNI